MPINTDTVAEARTLHRPFGHALQASPRDTIDISEVSSPELDLEGDSSHPPSGAAQHTVSIDESFAQDFIKEMESNVANTETGNTKEEEEAIKQDLLLAQELEGAELQLRQQGLFSPPTPHRGRAAATDTSTPPR